MIVWLVMGILPLPVFAQQKVSWETLAKVNYEFIRKEGQALWFGKASFPPEIQSLEGQQIRITGHVLPADASENSYILSAFPFSSCYFCGGAGPESVVELHLKKRKEKYKLDEVVTFTGILRLNDREMELNYILEEAEAE